MLPRVCLDFFVAFCGQCIECSFLYLYFPIFLSNPYPYLHPEIVYFLLLWNMHDQLYSWQHLKGCFQEDPALRKKKIIPSPSAFLGFPGGSVVKNPHANAGGTRDTDAIPGLRRFPGEGNGKPLQYSCLDNSMDRGVRQATVHGVAKSQTWRTHTHTDTHTHTHCLLSPSILRPPEINRTQFELCSYLHQAIWVTLSMSNQCLQTTMYANVSLESCVNLWGFWNSYTLLKEITLKKWSYL